MMNRRNFVALASTAVAAQASALMAAAQTSAPKKGRIKQSVFKTVFDPKMPFEDMCRHCAEIGIRGMDMIAVEDWPTLKKYGLVPVMGPTGAGSFRDGIIRPELHSELEKSIGEAIDVCAEHGCPNITAVGGQRRGMSYEEGADNAVAMLNRVKAHAEDKGVNLCLEVMNSKYKDPAFGREDQNSESHCLGHGRVEARELMPREAAVLDVSHPDHGWRSVRQYPRKFSVDRSLRYPGSFLPP